MTLVTQKSAMPTRKLAMAAAVGPAIAEAWAEVMLDIYPALAGPAMSALAGALAALICGYLIRDRKNT